jgi:hypothetical protein
MNKFAIIQPALVLTILALCCGRSEAQSKTSGKTTAPAAGATAATKTTAPASTTTPPPAKAPVLTTLKYKNMTEWRKTEAYTKRKTSYDKVSPLAQTKNYKFQDGTKLAVSLDKKPSSTNMSGVVQKKVGNSKKESSGGYDCTVDNVVLTANSTSFLNNDYSGSVANIYPGACYTYAHLTDGSWQAQTGVRNALQVSTDNPNCKPPTFVTVNSPDQATLANAVAELFNRMPHSTANEGFTYQVSLADNSAAYNLQIGAAASGYGADLSNVYSTGNQSNHVHLTIDATKTLFSITTTPPDSGFFQDPKIESTPYLSFIGEVDYGVRVLANADLQFSSSQEADLFKASYSGFGVSASLNVKYGSVTSNVQTTINSYTIGGPGNLAPAYSLKELEAQIEKAFANCTFQQARPIKYVAESMGGDDLNTYSATDQFAVRSCVPANGGSAEIDNIVLTLSQGGDGKEPHTGFRIDVDPGMTSGDNGEPMFSVYTCGTENAGFANNSVTTVILTKNPKYKGAFDVETLQKAGGHIHIWPICYPPNSTSGIGYDLWQIVNLNMTINLKANDANPNPKPIGGAQSGALSWSLQGANMVQLDSRQTQQQVEFYFDSNLTAQGTKN